MKEALKKGIKISLRQCHHRIKKLSEKELEFLKCVAVLTPEQLDYARKVSKLLDE